MGVEDCDEEDDSGVRRVSRGLEHRLDTGRHPSGTWSPGLPCLTTLIVREEVYLWFLPEAEQDHDSAIQCASDIVSERNDTTDQHQDCSHASSTAGKRDHLRFHSDTQDHFGCTGDRCRGRLHAFPGSVECLG